MDIIQAIILGLVQGVTEFLPISSSGHLILAEDLMKINFTEMKGFDIAIHAGTLLAILIYFWKDFWMILKAVWVGIFNHQKLRANSELNDHFKLAGYLIIGTIPAIVIGLAFGDLIDTYFRQPVTVASLLLIVGGLFFLVEKIAAKISPKKEIGWREAIIIGIGQTLALVPGVSRSGSTISTGLLVGSSREKAARFSFLLGSVAILAATVLGSYKAYRGEFVLPEWPILLAGIVSSLLAGLLAMDFLMKYLKKHTLNLFGWYRIAAGIGFLTWALVAA